MKTVIEQDIESWEIQHGMLRLYIHTCGTLALDVTLIEPFNTPWDTTKPIKLKLEIPCQVEIPNAQPR
jgi:hypothetical protein